LNNSFAIRTRPVRTENSNNNNSSANNTNQTNKGSGITSKIECVEHHLSDLLRNHSTLSVRNQVQMDSEKTVHFYTYVDN